MTSDLDRFRQLIEKDVLREYMTESDKIEYQQLYNKLNQNQKTPEDIENIKKWDNLTNIFSVYNGGIIQYVSDLLNNKLPHQKEIQRLKEENSTLKKGVFIDDERIKKLEQDSKTNKEIVERLKKEIYQRDDLYGHEEEINLLKSILGEQG